MIKELTLETLQEKIMDVKSKEFKNENTVVIKFSANEWCQPCKVYQPIFSKVAGEFDNIDFYSVDVDEEMEVTAAFSIRNVPTTIIINKDKAKKLFSGLIQEKKLQEFIQENK